MEIGLMAMLAGVSRARSLATGIAALAVGMSSGPLDARSGERVLTCTNDASGASWQIRVDDDRGIVDSYPAHITDATISWHDATDGRNYSLDRKSGKLTVVVASSTGGNFLYHHCKLGD